MSQEVMSPEMVKKIAEYRRALDQWSDNQQINRRMLTWSAPAAAGAFFLSVLSASAAIGSSVLAYWYTWFSVVTFIGGCVLCVLTGISVFVRNLESPKPKAPIDDRTAERVYFNEGA